MARKKSFDDIFWQDVRIGQAISSRYRKYPKNSPKYAEGVRRLRKVGKIYGRYGDNINRYFNGKLDGNQTLMSKKLSRNIYMGTKAKGAVAG